MGDWGVRHGRLGRASWQTGASWQTCTPESWSDRFVADWGVRAVHAHLSHGRIDAWQTETEKTP